MIQFVACKPKTLEGTLEWFVGLVLQRVRQLWPQLVPPERLRESAQVEARPEDSEEFGLARGFGRSSPAEEEGPGFPASAEGHPLPWGEGLAFLGSKHRYPFP